jgi:RNA polymerase sigma factor (sigma-70 family)
VRLTAGSEGLEQVAQTPAEQDEAAYAVLQMTIDEALEQMPQQHRQMLTLRVEGCEVAEIAQRVGRSKRTVERILQECRKRLADLLEVDEDRQE